MDIKLKTEEFIRKAKLIHGDKYDYSLVEYKTSNKKVIVICPKHGPFTPFASVHLKGSSCKKCFTESRVMSQKEFIEKANKVHNNFYDYSKTIYKHSQEHIIVTCPIHNKDFRLKPNDHLNGCGCKDCSDDRKRKDVSVFIKEANNVHNYKYAYNFVKYKNGKYVLSMVYLNRLLKHI